MTQKTLHDLLTLVNNVRHSYRGLTDAEYDGLRHDLESALYKRRLQDFYDHVIQAMQGTECNDRLFEEFCNKPFTIMFDNKIIEIPNGPEVYDMITNLLEDMLEIERPIADLDVPDVSKQEVLDKMRAMIN